MPGSPKTTLTANIAADATSMTLDDASVLPAAPNICVIGDDSSAEIVSYTTINGNTVSGLVRALGGTTASVWPANSVVARNFTSFDHDRFKTNIEALAGEINDVVASDFSTSTAYAIGDYVIYNGVLYRFTAAHSAGAWDANDVTAVTVSSELKNKANSSALSSYAPLASPELTGAPKAPTATAGDSSTQIATTAFVATALSKEITYHTGLTVSVANNAEMFRITSSDVTTSTVCLGLTFATPDNVVSDVSWQSYSGYIKFTGTCKIATTANVILGKKGN